MSFVVLLLYACVSKYAAKVRKKFETAKFRAIFLQV